VKQRLAFKNTARPRSLFLLTVVIAAMGAAAIYLVALPTLWRVSLPYALLFAALGVVQIGTSVAVLARSTVIRILVAAAGALTVIMVWLLGRVAGVLPAPDPWVAVNTVVGLTGDICVGLEIIAVVGLAAIAARGPRKHPTRRRRALVAVALTPLVMIVLLGTALGVIASSDGFVGAGLPASTRTPGNLPAGRVTTVEYCRPDGVPLAMDLYTPLDGSGHSGPAPIVMYVHGGGFSLGDRKLHGLGAKLAAHDGALFTPLQEQLNSRGFVVASIDYRLAPGTPWPAQIADVKCAVRFLRAHATDLHIDPDRIGVWGSSAGGTLSSLLGLARPEAGFDHGQYMDQSSAVQTVVDMFGPPDLTDFAESDLFARFLLRVDFGASSAVRRSASPITYVAPGAPPFLILQGTDDASLRQSQRFAQRLQSATVPVTLVEVQGAGHSLITPGERPSADELTGRVVDFFTATLR